MTNSIIFWLMTANPWAFVLGFFMTAAITLVLNFSLFLAVPLLVIGGSAGLFIEKYITQKQRSRIVKE